MHPAFRVADVRLQLIHLVLLAPTPSHELIQRTPPLIQITLRIMIALPTALALLERLLYGANQPDVLVDHDAEGQDILLCLAVVEVAAAELEIGEAGQGAGDCGGELDLREGV